MPEDLFESLAAKVLAGEATSLERQRLDELFAQDPSLRQQFADLALARTVLREAGPLAQALDAAPAPIPQEQYGNGWLPAAWATCAVLLMSGIAYLLLPSRREKTETSTETQIIGYLMAKQGQPQIRRRGQALPFSDMAALRSGDMIRLSSRCEAHVLFQDGLVHIRGPQTLRAEQVRASRTAVPLRLPDSVGLNGTNSLAGATRTALFSPANKFLSMGLLVTRRETRSICLYSPAGSTRNVTPPILWKNEPGKTYNLTIIDKFNATTPPWRLNGVTSPIDFSAVPGWKDRPLSKDGLYRVRLSETDNPLSTSESTFRTLADAAAPAGTPSSAPRDKIERAWQSLVSNTPCLGDAVAELLTLPPLVADAELPLRLKLVAFGQLGLKDDYDATASKLSSRP